MKEQARAKEVHLKDYLWLLVKHRWAVLGFLAVSVAAVSVRTFTTAPVYRATAQILIEKENPNIVDFKEIYAVDSTAQDFYQTQYKILQSRFLAKRVIDRLKLYGQDKPGVPERRIDRFLGALKVEPVRSTRLVKINFESDDAALAARAANGIVDAYIDHNVESRLDASYGATDFLSKKIEEQRKKLEESELALLKYKERFSIISLKEKENITVQKLAELNSDALRAENGRVEAETRFRQAVSIQNNIDMIESIPMVYANPLITKLKADEADLLNELSERLEKYGEKHPRIITLNEKLRAIREKLSAETKKVVNLLKNEYEVAHAKERTLKAAFEHQKEEAQTLNKHSIAYEVLLRDVEANKQLYDILLTRLKETGISGGIQTTNVKVIDQAIVPDFPVRPKKARNVLFSVFFGLFGGIFAAFFIEYLDGTVKTSEDVKKYVRSPYLGHVPDFKEEGAGESVLVALESPRSSAAEAYRGIRTAIAFSSTGGERKTLLVTSAAPSEGKSVSIANLAVTMAQAGRRILLIDTDFRKPTIHRIFGMPKEPGFSNLLVGVASPEEVIKKTGMENLDVIPCGYIPPNPAELLGSESMRKTVELLSGMYDRVLLDSPPVLPVTDAVVMGALVDEVLIVIQAGKTSRDLASAAIEKLRDVRANIIGAFLNNVKVNSEGYHYYRYYRYGSDEKETIT